MNTPYQLAAANSLLNYRHRLMEMVPSRTWMFRSTFPTRSPYDPYNPYRAR